MAPGSPMLGTPSRNRAASHTGCDLRAYSLTLMKSIGCEQKLKSETLRNVRAQVTDLEPFR